MYVVTLQLDAASFEWLQALRVEHFPRARNWLPAHLTLLHSASVDQVNALAGHWSTLTDGKVLALHFTRIRSLGCGTAVEVDSPHLVSFRGTMLKIMAGEFTRQDQQPFKPHVTIQNKVESSAATALQQVLGATFTARQGVGCGVLIWRYLNGPWALDKVLPF